METSVSLFIGVIIGSNTIKNAKNYGAPTIKDGVYIGAESIIVGGIIIGEMHVSQMACVIGHDKE